MGNTSASTSKSGVYKSGFLLFPHSNRFHPVPSLEFWGIVVFGNVVFLALSFSSNIQQCLSRARVTVNSMGETPVPPFFFYGALTPGEGPLFQNKHSFYTPSSLFVKGARGFRPPSFFYGLLA